MKRKLFNAALFAAVLVAAPVSTFVSCADYDSDIENLQNQNNDLEALVLQKEQVLNDKIAALEAQNKELEAAYKAADEALKQALADKPADMRLFLGMELGEGNHDPARAAEIAASPELDFVLGSLHNLEKKTDFYEIHYESYEQCAQLMDEYADELVALSKLDFYDAMAHIGYTIRYMRRDGFDVSFDLEHFGDKVEATLKNLIAGGRGLEINCSGYRTKRILSPVPGVDILRLYKQLGGEIITVGSDAHRTNQAGKGLAEGLDTLRELGYKYYTVFEKRKPEFIKL